MFGLFWVKNNLSSIYSVKECAIRVALFEVVREVSIQNIRENWLGLLGVVGMKATCCLHRQPISEENNNHRFWFLEPMDSFFLDHFLEVWLISNEIKFFNSSHYHIQIDLRGQVISVGWTSYFNISIQFIRFESTLVLVLTHPHKPVISQELFHFLDLIIQFPVFLFQWFELSNTGRWAHSLHSLELFFKTFNLSALVVSEPILSLWFLFFGHRRGVLASISALPLSISNPCPYQSRLPSSLQLSHNLSYRLLVSQVCWSPQACSLNLNTDSLGKPPGGNCFRRSLTMLSANLPPTNCLNSYSGSLPLASLGFQSP